MEWKALFTAFVGALGGTTTALVVVGFFGKTLLEHWFNKGLKRFEAELNDRAAKSRIKFEHAHPEMADAAKDVYRMCADLYSSVVLITLSRVMGKEHVTQAFLDNKAKAWKEIPDKLVCVHNYMSERPYFFDTTFIAEVSDFIDCATVAIDKEGFAGKGDFSEVRTALTAKLKAIENSTKTLLGIQNKQTDFRR